MGMNARPNFYCHLDLTNACQAEEHDNTRTQVHPHQRNLRKSQYNDIKQKITTTTTKVRELGEQ